MELYIKFIRGRELNRVYIFMKRIVYVLGNPLIIIDSLPFKLLPKLRQLCPQFNFEILDPTEELQLADSQDFTCIDTIIGIDKVTVFHDLDFFAYSPRVTVHDYDLPLNLGLMQKLGKLKRITIIGVPAKGNQAKILNEVINSLYIHLNFKK